MQGQQPRHRRGGSGRGAPPPPELNPNFLPQYPNNFYQQNLNPFAPNPFFQNPIFPLQNPNFPVQDPNFPLQNANFQLHTSTFPIQQASSFIPNQNAVPVKPRLSNRPDQSIERIDRAVAKAHHDLIAEKESASAWKVPQASNFIPNQNTVPVQPRLSNRPDQSIERIDRAVAKAHHDLIAAKESVSAWKVSQHALLALKADSWEALGVQMQLVPSLNRLISVEGKINAFIHCFVAVQRITSLYDLEVAICKSEGVVQFEELELGPLVRHPLVMHYFSVSPDLTEVFKITSDEIVSCLCEFTSTQKHKEIKVEEFLHFIAKKRSITGSEKLCVRIQSLGMHMTLIRRARRSESTTVNKIFDDLQKKSEKRSCKHRPLLSLQKKELDDHFSSISQRVNSFSPLRGNWVGKRIKFSSSSEDDVSDDSDFECKKNDADAKDNSKDLLQNTRKDRVSGCPYPSAAEEMSRLGLKGEMDVSASAVSGSERCNQSNGLSKKKRKSGSLGRNITAPHKLPKKDKIGSEFSSDAEKKEFIGQNEADFLLEADLSLPSSSMKMFITTWKEACRDNTVNQVFERMLQFYKTTGQTRYKGKGKFADIGTRKKMMSMFSSYPCIGLLNVAVTSIKCGMWDSVYDAFQTLTEQEATNAIPKKCAEYESIEIEPAERVALVVDEHVSKSEQSVTVGDIVNKVSTYFELYFSDLSNVKSSLEKKFTLMRKLRECEFWLTKEFSVKEFESLGYGEFFSFFEKHASLMPNTLQIRLTDNAYGNSPLEVCMLQHQLAVLLSQASSSLGGVENVTKEMLSALLMRQFPQISFTLVESSSFKDFRDIVRENENTSTCVLFSATLLGNRTGGSVSEKALSKTTTEGAEIGHKTGSLRSLTTKDAIEGLLRAPLLADLESWMHWDLRFAPSLGPFVAWLLNEVNTKELLCLVTKDGKVVRVDHLSTVDSFLEASLQGSSFQTAVKLLSLLSLYGGEQHVPLPLLKCYARQAFEVLTKNFTEVSENETFLTHGHSLHRLHMSDVDASGPSIDLCRTNGPGHVVTIAASFFLDCLGHFPTEFRAFAADILLSGLQSVIKDAPLAILSKCKQIKQRLMLHDVGLSLGIVEWIDDYHVFASNTAIESFSSSGLSCLQAVSPEYIRGSTSIEGAVNKLASTQGKVVVSTEVDRKNEECNAAGYGLNIEKNTSDCFSDKRHLSVVERANEAAMIVESIRREEFGLDPRLSQDESSILKKQHARLGRALHCLSQELYSQDSHFLLELIQNADDNVYQPNVEPTLSFILQDSGIIVLNNEQGFSEENIRALCDVGNSTKKGSSTGYIGKKGIGFKSVFRVTDAPEIHSNGFHVKFDITEGQIGFVLPTVLPPCDINLLHRLVCCDTENMDTNCWNTCIVLPFRRKVSEPMDGIKTMFLDLHPSLLLFLHRLQCIRFRDMVSDDMIVMKKQNVGNGIIKVLVGNETMTWFVESQELQADIIRPDVKTTEISIAFTLQESVNEGFIPCLDQQPVFAFLPLRRYGLKFIIQGDFVLPSSREEVDGDSLWNQWLLSKFPDLFVGAERSFCALPCFSKNPGKAVAAFMSFVPLVGEVHGFFSSLPRLIISKLRTSKCLLVEGDNNEWVLPCKVMRSWNQQARSLLPDNLLHEHLGLGFLDENIVLSDSLARDLGIQEYGPQILLRVISSLCYSKNGLKSVSLVWLSSLLNTLYTMVLNSARLTSMDSGAASDPINVLKKVPFIPLSDGTYSSVDDGTIWLHSDGVSPILEVDNGPDVFPLLYAQLRTVSPALLSAAATVDISYLDMSVMGNVIRMLEKVGVQKVSAHEIMMVHILPAISDEKITEDKKCLMIEYLSFVLLHFQSSCPNCHAERGQIIAELHKKAFVSTNHGFKRPGEVWIHFSKEFGNPIDVNKLIGGLDLIWHEVDVAYLKHPLTGSLPDGMMKWREFFQEIGITDFVHVVPIERKITDISPTVLKNMLWDGDLIYHGAIAKDWESAELFHLLSLLSSSGALRRCKFLLEVLDTFWDECFDDKATGQVILNSPQGNRIFQSSFMSNLCGVQWMVSSLDDKLHYSKELFHDTDAVRSILGAIAPYVVPKVKSEKLLCHIGFRTEVSLDDIFVVLQVWRRSEIPFMASIAQMTKFYTFIWNEMATSKQKIVDELRLGPFIFVPKSVIQRHEDVVPGVLVSPSEVYWHDLTGSVNQVKEIHPHSASSAIGQPLCKTLCNVYPSLHEFFTSECGVNEEPCLRSYFDILLQLSTVALPYQAADAVFRVFLQWSNGLISGVLSHEDLSYLKESLLKVEFAVLPTVLDKWVSLNPSFGLICWCDDENLKKEFKHFDNIDFLYFGKLSDDEQEMLRVKVSVLLHNLGIPALSEVITREAIHYGLADHTLKASLLNWALPYAQRYIYNLHHGRYCQLKQIGFENLSHLKIVAVEKLFYRNVLTRSGVASKKRFECSCLLLGNVFYTTRESDPHALFMELSRLLFEGSPDLHLANFLHMITTMVESGSSEEQIEFFILNSQKIPKLPDEEESVWSLPSAVTSSTVDEETLVTASTVIAEQQNPTKSRRKSGINSSWPPAGWKTAPGFGFPRLSQYRAEEAIPPPSSSLHVMEDDSMEKFAEMDHIIQIEISSDWTVEGVAYNPSPSEASDNNPVASLLGSANDSIDLTTRSADPNLRGHKNIERDQFSFGTPSAEVANRTGRQGELVAFNYFTTKFTAKSVKWVNKDIESGLPYDLVISEDGKCKEYIEVKATKSLKKDWFFITSREWQFAFEKGESFSIAHVGLSGSSNNSATITLFKNPVRLCHQGKLQLAVVMPK